MVFLPFDVLARGDDLVVVVDFFLGSVGLVTSAGKDSMDTTHPFSSMVILAGNVRSLLS